jgi:hypothetical protein
MIDRVLKTVDTSLYQASLDIYRTRFWWDSASPTYFHQINGLLAYDIPKGNLLYGTVRHCFAGQVAYLFRAFN